MKRIFLRLLVAGLAIASTGEAWAQIGSKRTSKVSAVTSGGVGATHIAPPAAIEWRQHPEHLDAVYLYIGGRLRGSFNRRSNLWWSFDPWTRTWGPAHDLFPNLISPLEGQVPDSEPLTPKGK